MGTVVDIADDAPPLVPAGTPLWPRAPLGLGFCVVPGFVVIAPAGTLVAAEGALDAEFGEGGDWVEPDWPMAGADAMARAPAKSRAGAETMRVRVMVTSFRLRGCPTRSAAAG